MKTLKALLITALVSVSFSSLATPELTFLSAKQSAKELGKNDAFMRRLSQFDMEARMKTEDHIIKPEFRRFVRANTLDWTEEDKAKVQDVYANLQKELSKYPLDLPKEIKMILTTGKEEGTAAYTRGKAIILQRNKLELGIELKRIMAHEIFHIYTRLNSAKKDELYQSIGFQHVGEIEFPDDLEDRKITNPDAPVNDYAIKVGLNNEQVWAMPILYSVSEKYDLKKGGEFFNYLQFKFLVVADKNGEWTYDDDEPVIVDRAKLTGFFEQVGTNTNYIIHPEEILADNFALLMLRSPVVNSPEVIERMKAILSQ
ncbi:hypothetical protein CW749_11940 [Vibrio sp. vnigr-6D03]|uniref:hypothetical protein n=1 Tax=Vibrio sp. vnigr-6D03 TaxID=2058088 RepID=UPI000C328432|nr:hypothetical protein [Vibrio sp. vnigr-6D03]PKF79420.1 hypothetical protein CW749_11940 [Vibrio sp. vnigr-6D03]